MKIDTGNPQQGDLGALYSVGKTRPESRFVDLRKAGQKGRQKHLGHKEGLHVRGQSGEISAGTWILCSMLSQ